MKGKYTIKDLRKDFPNDRAILDIMFSTNHSFKCSCGGKYNYLGNKKYQCSKCRYQISPTANTIFHKTTTPLTDWLHAIYMFSQAKSGISAKELERQIGCTYKTAWRMLSLIRSVLPTDETLKGNVVEVDEAYIGGRMKRTGSNNEYNKVANKSVVYGAVDRKNKRIIAKVMPDATKWSAGYFINTHIKKGSTLYTDKTNRIDNVVEGYNRESVCHKREEYVRGEVHTNSIENFWGHTKRSITGTHKHISKEHAQSYVNAFAFHYNNRHSDKDRFFSLLSGLLSA